MQNRMKSLRNKKKRLCFLQQLNWFKPLLNSNLIYCGHTVPIFGTKLRTVLKLINYNANNRQMSSLILVNNELLLLFSFWWTEKRQLLVGI